MYNRKTQKALLTMMSLALLLMLFSNVAVLAQDGGELEEIQKIYIEAGKIWQKLYPQEKDAPALTQDAEREVYQELIAYYTEAINKHPEVPELELAYHHRGSAYFRTGQYEKALADFDMAIKLAPSADALKNRGLAYEHLGEYEKALNDYQEFLVVIKDMPTERRATERQDFTEKVKELREKLSEDNEMKDGSIEMPTSITNDFQIRGWVYGSWQGGQTAHNDTYNGQTTPNIPGFACGFWYPGHNIENAVWLNLPGSTYNRVAYYWNTWWGQMNGNDHYYASTVGWTPYPGYNYFIQIQNRDYCTGVHVDSAALYKIEGMYWD